MKPTFPLGEERQAAVTRISSAYAGGILTLDALERRMEALQRARSSQEIAVLVQDLPEVAGPMRSRIEATWSSVRESSAGAVPARVDAKAVFGDLHLDLSRARFTAEVTEIAVDVLLGDIRITVPSDAIVESRVDGYLSDVSVKSLRLDAGPPGAAAGPRIVITGLSLLGNVVVKAERAKR